jgi:hypothetical protein
MSRPIYVDPILDGAADPVVIWHAKKREWWMLYTNRRAGHEGPGVEWIHGTPIGTASSLDGWTWRYRGMKLGLDAPYDTEHNTHWAPEVIEADGTYHMFLSYIIGVPDRFTDTVRRIVHLTSTDLEVWMWHGPLTLSSDNCIDACVFHCPDRMWRLWYKDEADGSSTWAAVSLDLEKWDVEGRVIPGKNQDGFPHEGPNVFELGGHIWMIVDEWRGQAVFRSADARHWERQGLILDRPGRDEDDRSFARHADVVVQDGWAALYYFTHPGWNEAAKPVPETPHERRTVIHAARLTVVDGRLVAERDITALRLTPPTAPAEEMVN